MEKVLRSKADDLMRARKVSAAKDRTEQIVREGDLEKRMRGSAAPAPEKSAAPVGKTSPPTLVGTRVRDEAQGA